MQQRIRAVPAASSHRCYLLATLLLLLAWQAVVVHSGSGTKPAWEQLSQRPAPAEQQAATAALQLELQLLPSQADHSYGNGEAACSCTSCDCSSIRYRHFILHRIEPEMTAHAVKAAIAGGFAAADITVIDTSWQHEALAFEQLQELHIELWPTPVPLSYAQAMELVRRIAIARRLDVIFWQHADVQLHAHNSAAACHALEFVCGLGPRWGIAAFTSGNTDAFCAFNTAALEETGIIDPYIPLYRSDIDYYQRMWSLGYHLSRRNGDLAVHLNGGSNTLKSQTMPVQQTLGMLLENTLGRDVYFWLKWEHGKPEQDHPFEAANDMWPRIKLVTRFLNEPTRILLILHATLYALLAVHFVASMRRLGVLPALATVAFLLPQCSHRHWQRTSNRCSSRRSKNGGGNSSSSSSSSSVAEQAGAVGAAPRWTEAYSLSRTASVLIACAVVSLPLLWLHWAYLPSALAIMPRNEWRQRFPQTIPE